MRRLNKNEFHNKFIDWTKNVLIEDNVPHDLFRRGVERCSGFDYDSDKLPVAIRNSRYSALIVSALNNRKGRERHYVVQKYLVESPITSMVISEIPIWSPRPRVGHIDLIGFEEGRPSIVVYDYKPKLLFEKQQGIGQVMLYTIMLSMLTKIPLEEIGGCTFDEKAEIIFSR